MKKPLALLGVAAALMVVAIATPALATTNADCKTVTVQNVDKQDNGHHGYWADLTLDRAATICVDETKGEGETLHTRYTATVHDMGALTTIKDAQSPRNGVIIANAVAGTVIGDYVEPFTAPGVAWAGYTGTAPAETVTTGNWVKTIYGGAISTNGLTEYKWTYKTCCDEKWIDSSTNNDGQDEGAGDITGKPCPPPVVITTTTPGPTVTATATAQPTATATATATVTTASTTQPPATTVVTTTTSDVPLVPVGNDTTTLPVTGSSLPVIIGSGSALLLVGLALVMFYIARRRRDAATMTDDTIVF